MVLDQLVPKKSSLPVFRASLVSKHTNPSNKTSQNNKTIPDPSQTEPSQGEQRIECENILTDFRLLTLDDLAPEKISEFRDMALESPRPPSLLNEIINQTPMNTFDAKELANLVGTDPLLAAKVLQMVNSSYFGLSQQVTSVHKAVVYLGYNMVKDIAVQHTLENLFKPDNQTVREASLRFWVASFVASALSFRMAQHYEMVAVSNISTRTLFSYLGNFLILSQDSDHGEVSARGVFERTLLEQERLQANAAILGAILAEEWNLPQIIVNGIRESILPMVSEAQPIQKNDPVALAHLREQTLCYVSCRIGDQVAFQGLRDIANTHLDRPDVPELFYLPSYLKAAGFEDYSDSLKDPKLAIEINKLIVGMLAKNKLQ